MEEKQPDSMQTMPETDELAKKIENEAREQLGQVQGRPPPQPFTPGPRTFEELHDIFFYHAPSMLGIDRHAALALKCIELAQTIDSVCPAGREKSLAFTKLEEAKFWASAAVARNPETR